MTNKLTFSSIVNWVGDQFKSDSKPIVNPNLRNETICLLQERIKRPEIPRGINRRVKPADMDNRSDWKLPLEVFQLVLRYVSPCEYTLVSSVSKYWQYGCLDSVTTTQVNLMKNVDKFFPNYVQNNELSYTKNLSELQQLLFEMRSRVAEQLVRLPVELKIAYAKLNKPLFFDGLLDLAELLRTPKYLSSQVGSSYVQLGVLDKALELIKLNKNKVHCDTALFDLLEVMKEEGVEKEIVSLIELPIDKAPAVAKCFLMGKVYKGIEIAHALEEGNCKSALLKALPLMIAIVENDYREAVQADLFLDEDTEFLLEFVENAIHQSVENGSFYQIKEQLLSITNHKVQSHMNAFIYAMIAKELIKLDQPKEAMEIMQGLKTHKNMHFMCIYKIIMEFGLKGQNKEVSDIASMFEHAIEESLRLGFHEIIATFKLIEEEEFETSIQKICTDGLFVIKRDETFSYISLKMMAAGKHDEAIKTALMIEDFPMKYKTVKLIRDSIPQ